LGADLADHVALGPLELVGDAVELLGLLDRQTDVQGRRRLLRTGLAGLGLGHQEPRYLDIHRISSAPSRASTARLPRCRASGSAAATNRRRDRRGVRPD